MILICNTSSDGITCQKAMLQLTPEDVDRLLAYRLIWAQVAALSAYLYRLEFLDYEVAYGAAFENEHIDIDDGEWFYLNDDPRLLRQCRTTGRTLNVQRDGVFWAATTREQGSRAFETPKITWEQLERIKKKGQPFQRGAPETSLTRKPRRRRQSRRKPNT